MINNPSAPIVINLRHVVPVQGDGLRPWKGNVGPFGQEHRADVMQHQRGLLRVQLLADLVDLVMAHWGPGRCGRRGGYTGVGQESRVGNAPTHAIAP